MKFITTILAGLNRHAHPARRPEQAARAPLSAAPAPHPRPALVIACPDPVEEDRARDAHSKAAQNLVRQEDWAALSKRMAVADAALAKTPGGMPVTELLSFGARADVVQAAEHALFDGQPEPDAPLMQGIEALEQVLEDYPDDPMIAAVVAQAHMDLGWAWRGLARHTEVPQRNRAAFDAHFERARDILGDFADRIDGSALLCSTRCALLGGADASVREVAERYEALIDLDPKNMRAMRAMGSYLLPRWFGSYADLELEARRLAVRTRTTWGAGAYTWVMFDAISADDDACACLDLNFFIDGLHDILARHNDHHTVNLLAAYCANTMGEAHSGNDKADQVRSQIAACAEWIVREHLTELHAMVWAHAARGFDNNLRVRSVSRFAAAGLEDAMRILERIFRSEIAAGNQVVFTDQGVTTQSA